MARPGITYQDVANAAITLTGEGKYPTIENIRLQLGTGSSSTIAPYLRTWRAKQNGPEQLANKENIPTELVALLKGLWERVVQLADDKINAIEKSHGQEIGSLQTSLEKSSQDIEHWQQQYYQVHQEKILLAEEKAKNLVTIANLEKEKNTLQSNENSLIKQLEEKQQRVEELHHLHHQVQMNLEHYREASREQRLIDQQKFDQKEQQLTQNIQNLQGELKTIEQNKILIEQQWHVIKDENLSIQALNEELSLAVKNYEHTLLTNQTKCNEYENKLSLIQNQQEMNQEKIKEQNELIAHLNTQIALVNKEITHKEAEFKILSEKHTAITHEKWYLIQEKSQLEGQLKQLDKLVTLSKSYLVEQ